MSKDLGYFADREGVDNPDLNKCPDCECFFGGDFCPICGKECPEDMRAGNRKPPKKKRRSRGGSSRVTFIEWYHSWWFIAIMMVVMPIVGIILLLTSPHKKWVKILVAVLMIIYTVFISSGLIWGIIDFATTDRPSVNTKITEAEYRERCESVPVEEFYRMADAYANKYVKLELTVSSTVYDGVYTADIYKYYICTALVDGVTLEYLVRDCSVGTSRNYIAGDMITVYGQGAGTASVYISDVNTLTAPCVNMAYSDLDN